MAKLPAPSVPENVPFDQAGNLVRWPLYADDVQWQRNAVFKRRLVLDAKLYHASSSKFVVWRDETQHEYSMFVTDLLRLNLEGCVIAGRCIGPWTFTKRGTAYGLVYVREKMLTPRRPVFRYPADATKEIDVPD